MYEDPFATGQMYYVTFSCTTADKMSILTTTFYSGGSRISCQGRQLPAVRQPIILQSFCRKLHENERIWTGGRPWRPQGYNIIKFTMLFRDRCYTEPEFKPICFCDAIGGLGRVGAQVHAVPFSA